METLNYLFGVPGAVLLVAVLPLVVEQGCCDVERPCWVEHGYAPLDASSTGKEATR